VEVKRSVPGDRLVRADGVVVVPVGGELFGQLQGVVDLVPVEPVVLQRAEPAFA
jgi:hypothetical protein